MVERGTLTAEVVGSNPASPASMVDRVAAAIGVPEASGFVCEWSLDAARRAIEAMREPTQEQKWAGAKFVVVCQHAEQVYQAMIDEALK